LNTYERRQSLLEILRKQPGLRVPEMAEGLGVSEGTIRNDLNALEADGHLTRYHGGAILSEQTGLQNTSFSARHEEHSQKKMVIARHAAKFVNDGDSILLDASSTVYYLGLAIQGCQRLRVVTNGMDVARLLAKNPTNSVMLVGGTLNQDGSSVSGLFSEQIIQELHIQKAFVSCSGFNLEHGMTEVHLNEAHLKRKAIESSAQVIALVDSSKFGKEDLTTFASIHQITFLFTDTGLSSDWRAKLAGARITFTLCDEGGSP
jgi:DeoR/GlpR family transcriptional regulator of sugar metabolism